MKRFTRAFIILAFALANLALAGTPADAFRMRTAECEAEDGDETEVCCIRCWIFCEGCDASEV